MNFKIKIQYFYTINFNKDYMIMANRLVMVKEDHCQLCDKISSKSHRITIAENEGWIVCNDCIETQAAKKNIIEYIDKTKNVPTNFLYNQEFNDIFVFKVNGIRYIVLKFWRQTQKKVYITSNIIIFNRYMQLHNDDYVKNFNFVDIPIDINDDNSTLINIIENITDLSQKNRSISLKNLIYYNKDLYDSIVNCDNLLGKHCPVKITFNDLPSNIQENIKSIPDKFTEENKRGIFDL
jgi:hypothetical protein